MNSKIRMFTGAFVITVILIGALCGFVAVDLSTDRYMPDTFGPFFEITSIGEDGVSLRFMAESYRLETETANAVLDGISRLRGLLPAAPRIAGRFAELGARYAMERISPR